MISSRDSFAEQLKMLRKARDLTQRELAIRAECSVRTIEKIEEGIRRPSEQLAERLAEQLGLARDDREAFLRLSQAGGDKAPRAAIGEVVPPSPAVPHALIFASEAARPGPVVPTLVGREQEAEAIATLLTQESVRLVTLAGPPGIGKTSLALHVASVLSGHFARGVCYVSLAAVTTTDQVVPAVAYTLGLGQSEGEGLLDSLVCYLHDAHLLLVLDNFEQVSEAAPLLSRMIDACPHVKVLVTSRELLRLSAEHAFWVGPLDLPGAAQLEDPSSLEQSPAVQLFAERARAVLPGFSISPGNARTVGEVCLKLEGVPLSIELAAALLKEIPPEDLLARLSGAASQAGSLHLPADSPANRPEHQSGLASAMEWSYRLLIEEEKRLFAWLSVFAGGSSLEAVEAVCGDAPQCRLPGTHLLDHLQALVDKSLLLVRVDERDDTLFTMLETVRQYAGEMLEARGEATAARDRHARYFLELANRARTGRLGPEQALWPRRIARERANLRAAFNWLLAGEDKELALRLAGYLGWFRLVSGQHNEGRDMLERALAATSVKKPQPVYGYALCIAGVLARDQGDKSAARSYLQQSLEMFQARGDRRWEAYALAFLGALAAADGASEIAQKQLEAAVAICREIGDRWGLGLALVHLGQNEQWLGHRDVALRHYAEATEAYRALGDQWGQALASTALGNANYEAHDYEQAGRYYEQALRLLRVVGGRSMLCWVLTSLGHVYLQLGEFRRAVALYEESLPMHREFGNRWSEAYVLNGLGEVARLMGKHRGAEARYRESMELFRQLDDKVGIAWTLHNLARVWSHHKQFSEAMALYTESLQLFREKGHVAGIAASLSGVGVLLGRCGQAAEAVRLLTAAEDLLMSRGLALEPVDRAEHQRTMATLRARTNPATFASAVELGETTTLAQAIDIACHVADLPLCTQRVEEAL